MKRQKRKIAGVVSIEFALSFMAFWTLLMGWFEANYISYISSVCDYAIAQSSRKAKKEGEDYLTVFKETLYGVGEGGDGAFWGKLLEKEKFKIRVSYVNDLPTLEMQKAPCKSPTISGAAAEAICGEETLQAIAIYYITYDYGGLFTFLTSGNTVFAREVIVIQEYQRSAF